MKPDANAIAKAHGKEELMRAFDLGARGFVNGHTAPSRAQVALLSGTAVQPLAVDWIWPGWLARGKLHLLAGSPGTAKTTIALCLGAAITAGAQWPDGTDVRQGNVLVWSGEDGIADTLLPRFLSAGGIAGIFTSSTRWVKQGIRGHSIRRPTCQT